MAVSGPWQLECEKIEQRFGYLLNSGLWSDCTFMVGSEIDQEMVSAHKLILAIASPVFDAMFYRGLSEPMEPVIPIPDVQPEAFRALLRYIYTGEIIIDSFDMAWDMWYGAKKYMLPHLVKECNSYIYSVISPMNVCRAYELACFFDEQILMDKCIKIICTDTIEVLNNGSFEDVELNTLITVLSLDHLNVDSELDLIHAVARYAEAEQKRQEQISSSMNSDPLSDKQSDLKLETPTPEEKGFLPSVESSPTNPAKLESKSPSEIVTSKPTADRKKFKERHTIRTAIENIRFLTLTIAQFAEGATRSGLLTEGESFAIIMNIISGVSSVPMPTGFSESRERRRPRRDSVEEGSIAEPRPKRCTEFVATTKLSTPAEIVRGLLSHGREKLEEAARAARYMTCADADGTSENLSQLVAAGAIPPLVAALHHPRTGVQYEASWAITNIACNGEYTSALVNDGAVPKLVALVERGDGAVAEQAAWALGNIAGGADSARATVLDAGAASTLLAHMQPSTPPAPLATYLRTYRIICQKPMSSYWLRPMFELLSPAVPYIENLLELADEQVLAEACWILYHLGGGAHFNAQLFTPSLATRLTALLGHDAPGGQVATPRGQAAAPRGQSAAPRGQAAAPRGQAAAPRGQSAAPRVQSAAPRVQTAALGAVGSVLGAVELIDRYVAIGCLDHLLNFLKSRNPSHVEFSARAAGNILRRPHHIQQALDEGILDALRPALTDGNDQCKLYAGRAITNLCMYGSVSQLRVLVECAALQPYCSLLAAGRRTTNYVMCGITSLLRKPQIRFALLLKLREIGVPQLLITLQREGGEHRELANDLLRNHLATISYQ